ncbi:MAG: RsiG family protein [Mycobacteriales bacterium]
MEGVVTGGNRRIDRVLGEDYVVGLSAMPLDEVRALRDEADQEETDLSFVRRLLQGRLDILQAELARRERGEPPSPDFIGDLTRILADGERGPARGMGRHQAAEPSRAGESRRYVESLVADIDLSNVTERSVEELTRAEQVLRAEEEKVSSRRRAVQGVLDTAGAEIGRRYRDGEAQVSTLLVQGPDTAGD